MMVKTMLKLYAIVMESENNATNTYLQSAQSLAKPNRDDKTTLQQ